MKKITKSDLKGLTEMFPVYSEVDMRSIVGGSSDIDIMAQYLLDQLNQYGQSSYSNGILTWNRFGSIYSYDFPDTDWSWTYYPMYSNPNAIPSNISGIVFSNNYDFFLSRLGGSMIGLGPSWDSYAEAINSKHVPGQNIIYVKTQMKDLLDKIDEQIIVHGSGANINPFVIMINTEPIPSGVSISAQIYFSETHNVSSIVYGYY